jgi:uncharacterized integral membrane protein
MKGFRWYVLAGIVALSAVFSSLNRVERVVIDLGAVTLYRAPLTTVVLVSFLLGMVAMFLLGLQQDLRLRNYIRERESELAKARASERRLEFERNPVQADATEVRVDSAFERSAD